MKLLYRGFCRVKGVFLLLLLVLVCASHAACKYGESDK